MDRQLPKLHQKLTRSCLLALAVACAGCSSIELADGIEPTRVRSIERGEARQTVEELLGEPLRITQTATGSLASYHCNLGLPQQNLATGRTAGADEPEQALGSERYLAARNALFSFMFLGAPEIYARQAIERQRGIAVVTYDAQGRVQDERVRCVERAPDADPFFKIY